MPSPKCAATLTDTELRDLVIENPKKGWPLLWDSFGDLIRSRVRVFRLSQEDTEDLLQEISLHLIKDDFKVLRSWDSNRSALAVFLSVVVTTRCLDFVRTSFHRYTQRKATPGPDTPEGFDLLDVLESEEKTPAERLHLLQVAETLDKCLDDLCRNNGLKPIDRQLVELRAMGLDFKEVAQILGIQDGNAMTRFFRLKEQLVASLKKAGVRGSDIHE